MSKIREIYADGAIKHEYTYFEDEQVVRMLKEERPFSVTDISQKFKKFFLEVFLPHGYPSSVSSDYLEYQIWDTVQAFCSTISGTLTTHAILKGVGVGDVSATPLAATVTWILKDGSGMIGRIIFAWWKGCALDTDCKKWRLAADVINDTAMCVELLVGNETFRDYSSFILCMSTTLKAIVGAAGGATRAAITQHQAIRGNMADVSAKDGSQETCVNLVASFTGLLILSYVQFSSFLTWLTFAVATVLHLYANYRAVRCVVMKTLNAERLILLLEDYLNGAIVFRRDPVTPEQISAKESVILGTGISDVKFCSYRILMGMSLKCISNGACFIKLEQNVDWPYIVISDDKGKILYISLYKYSTSLDVIQAYVHATLLALLNSPGADQDQPSKAAFYVKHVICCKESSKTSEQAIVNFSKQFLKDIREIGWAVDSHQLPVGGWRII